MKLPVPLALLAVLATAVSAPLLRAQAASPPGTAGGAAKKEVPAAAAAVVAAAPGGVAVVAEEEYRTLTLASGLKLEVPKAWNAVRGSDSQPVEKVGAEFLKPEIPPQNGGSITWLQVLGPAATGQVSLTIRGGPSTLAAAEQQHLQKPESMTAAELARMREAILHDESQAMGMREMRELSELKAVRLGTKWAIAYHYELPALPGGEPDAVEEYLVQEGRQALHFVFSRPVADTTRWQDVFEHIRGSVHFPGAGEAAGGREAPVRKR